MLKHIPFQSLYVADHGWLKSHFHFSFAEYHNPSNIHYGVLRVMNDDFIAPHTGFDTHPHRDMEIFTYVLQGTLTHQDSMGYQENLSRGSIQYMSAGSGILHSEANKANNELHLIQTWILPREKGIVPRYGSKYFEEKERLNKWLHIMGNDKIGSAIPINQDVNIYVTEMEKGQQLSFILESQRQLYVKVMEGQAMINKELFSTGDAGESDEDLFIHTVEDQVHLLVIEMPKN